MSDPGHTAGPRSFPLIGRIADSELGQRRDAEFERCGQPYMIAMLNGQMLEVLCELAAPALTAPLDDDEEAEAIVRS